MTLQCMLTHGLGGSPFEMAGIAAALEKAGLEAHLLTLPGHAASEDAFMRVSYADWRAYMLAEHARLARRGPVLAVGFSLGGLLSLDVAESVPLAGVVTLAAPVYLYCWHPLFMLDWRLPLAGLLHHALPVLRGQARSAEAQAIAPWRGYEGLTVTRHVADMMTAQRRVRAGLRSITAPALLWQARGDATCRAWNALYLAGHLGSAEVTLRMVDIQETRAGQHLLPTHRETRDAVAASVCDFALRVQERLS